MLNNNMRFLSSVGYSVIVFAASIELVSTIIFFAGSAISQLNFWIALVLTIILLRDMYSSIFKKQYIKPMIWNLLILLGIFLIGAFFSDLFYDLSYDGQAFQLEAIIQLANNWNPILGNPVGVIHDIWINHYPKGPWVLSTVFYHLTGIIETAKVFNFAFLIAAFLISISTLAILFPKQKGKVISIAFLLAFNPIAITQLTNFYVDGQLYSLLLIIACVIFKLYKEYGTWELVILCLSIILVVNIKFYALVYVGLIGLGYAAILLLFKKQILMKKIIWPVIASFLIGAILVGFNPYITNSINKGNPFYPSMGKGAVDTVTPNSPMNFITHNSINNLAHSLLSESDNPIQPRYSKVKTPFSIKKSELKVFASPDVRVGGFGPLFGAGLLLAALTFLVSLVQDRKKVWYIIFPGAILLLTVIVNPTAWWANHVPQLWIAPILIIIFAFLTKKRFSSILSTVLLAILLTNTLLVSGYHFKEQYKLSRQVDKQLDQLASDGREVQIKSSNHYSNRIRLSEHGIKYKMVETLTCNDKKQSFPNSETEYCQE